MNGTFETEIRCLISTIIRVGIGICLNFRKLIFLLLLIRFLMTGFSFRQKVTALMNSLAFFLFLLNFYLLYQVIFLFHIKLHLFLFYYTIQLSEFIFKNSINSIIFTQTHLGAKVLIIILTIKYNQLQLTSKQLINKQFYLSESTMDQTLKLLGAIDMQIKRQSLKSTPKNGNKKFPFAGLIQFGSDKFNQYPKWLTERQDFLQFMYKKYETKLLSIAKICQKDEKESDQKYFISLYLEQIPIFKSIQENHVKEILLSNVKTKYYSANQVIHPDEQEMKFMAVIFVGSVSYEQKGMKIRKIKNDVIMTEAFYDKTHPQIIADEQTVLLTFHKDLYPIIQDKIMKDINQKSRDQIADLIKSDFFIQLHLKDKKARNFFSQLKPQFYFKGQRICKAGDLPQKFYITFRGSVKELNHIYIREHNKWPLQVKRWEVRAVYNAFQNDRTIGKYEFFGDEEIISASRLKSTYIANTHCILFSMDKNIFLDSLTNQDFKRLKKYRNEHININYSDFQKSIRERVRSQHQKKKIIHKAIDTSFAHRNQFPKRKISLVERFEKRMLTSSVVQDLNTTIQQ